MVWESREQWGCRTHQWHKINLGRQIKSDCEELPNIVLGLNAWARKWSGDIQLQWKEMCTGDKTVSPVHAEHREGTLELHHLLPAKRSPWSTVVAVMRAVMKEMQSKIHNFCLPLYKLKVEPDLKHWMGWRTHTWHGKGKQQLLPRSQSFRAKIKNGM